MARRRREDARGYRSLFELSSGGMGEVTLAARNEGRFSRLYAVKRLHSQHAEDESIRSMFLEEARLAGLVSHPNVVGVLDVGEDRTGPFLVMDYVDGLSAATIAEQAAPLPLQVVLRIGADVAQGLHAAHELQDVAGRPLGLVHRDVSPQNVLVGFDAVSRIGDFGIAKALGAEVRTSTGILKGKLGYMAPEQLRFETIDRRADLFALGVVLWELFGGSRLYKRPELEQTARAILHEPAPDVRSVRSEVPASVAELLADLLAKEPVDRPSDAASVARRLDEVRAELVLGEGPFDLADWLEVRFGERRRILRERVATALVGGGEDTEPRPGAGGRRRGWVRVAMIAGASLLLMAAGAVAVVALGGTSSGDAVPAARPRLAPAAASVGTAGTPSPSGASAIVDTPDVAPRGAAPRKLDDGARPAASPGATRRHRRRQHKTQARERESLWREF